MRSLPSIGRTFRSSNRPWDPAAHYRQHLDSVIDSLVTTLVVDGHRVQEVFVKVVDELENVALHVSRHANIVDERQVNLLSVAIAQKTYDVFAETDSTSMRTDGHAELCGHEENAENLADTTETA
jgi:hypothetical protein